MLDISSLKKAVKWVVRDKVVIFSVALGVILLLVTLIFFSENVNLVRQMGIGYRVGEKSYCRLLFKITTPALAVNTLLQRIDPKKFPGCILLYSLMFAVQIVAYGAVGKVARVMISGRIVAVFICIGIILLALAMAYDIDPGQSSVLDTARKNPLYLLLMIANLPTLFAGQYLSGVLGRVPLLYFILFPFMFIIQILIYGFLGKLLSNMLMD